MKTIAELFEENTSEKNHFVDVIAWKENFGFLVLRRANYMKNFRGMWGVVGGSIENKETVEDAAYRELKEETGINKNQVDKLWEFAEIKHQNGNNTEVWVANLKDNFDTDSVKISGEHSQYKWITEIDQLSKGTWMPNLKEVLIDFTKEKMFKK